MHWIVFMTLLYLQYAPWFVLVEHTVHRQPFSVLTNVFTLQAYCLLSTLLVLTLSMCELCHCPSMASMSPQNNCDNEEDGHIGLLS